jgi:hypothetical protein
MGRADIVVGYSCYTRIGGPSFVYCCTAVFRSSDTRWPTRLGVGPRAQDSHAEEQQAAAQLAAAVTLIRGTLPPPFPTHACVRLLVVSHRPAASAHAFCVRRLPRRGWLEGGNATERVVPSRVGRFLHAGARLGVTVVHRGIDGVATYCSLVWQSSPRLSHMPTDRAKRA